MCSVEGLDNTFPMSVQMETYHPLLHAQLFCNKLENIWKINNCFKVFELKIWNITSTIWNEICFVKLKR